MHALESEHLLEIPDLAADPRTADNPLVTGELALRFYAGAPLRTEAGLMLGTLCLLDTRPRTLREDQRAALRILGRQVMVQLESRRALRAETEAVHRAEAQAAELERLLEAERVLKLEIDHRVKNSLQLVASLLQMQAARSGPGEVRDALLSARGRVSAISTIHAALNRGGDVSHVMLDRYAVALVEDLRATAPEGVAIELDVEPVRLSTSQASSLAILLNEFVTNSLKYAFPGGRRGRVSLSIRQRDGRVHARFADDGVGHDASSDRAATSGLGTRIMQAVGAQLGARIEIVADPRGTSLAFDFPIGLPVPHPAPVHEGPRRGGAGGLPRAAARSG